MDEQMKITMDLDEAICVLKELSKEREELVTTFRNLGMQEAEMEHFRVECALEIAIKAMKKQVSVSRFSA